MERNDFLHKWRRFLGKGIRWSTFHKTKCNTHRQCMRHIIPPAPLFSVWAHIQHLQRLDVCNCGLVHRWPILCNDAFKLSRKKKKNISSHLKNYTARLSIPWLLPLLVGCSQCVLMRMERRTENAAAGYVALNGVNTQNKQISHIYVNKNYLAQGTMNVLSFEPGCKTCCTRQ